MLKRRSLLGAIAASVTSIFLQKAIASPATNIGLRVVGDNGEEFPVTIVLREGLAPVGFVRGQFIGFFPKTAEADLVATAGERLIPPGRADAFFVKVGWV